jgi:sulfur carrier protein
MRVFMRIPERKEFFFSGKRTVSAILAELEINPETVIVIRGDTLLTPDDVVCPDDEIEIRPAITRG